MDEKIIYNGGIQSADTILEKLAGPIGDGEVIYPNGDRFKGVFNLSYRSIWNSAYTARGRYTFADGSVIENAWINTDSEYTVFDLHGLFRIHHPGGSDSVAMFWRHKRYGLELFLNDRKPYLKEWYAGKEQHREHPLELIDYTLDDSRGGECLVVSLHLKADDGVWHVEQRGGVWQENEWNNRIYKPAVSATVCAPDGDSYDDIYGFALRQLRPYGFYVNYHCAATMKVSREEWKDGRMVKAGEWEYDPLAAKAICLPNPWGGKLKAMEYDALVWPDGHITYGASHTYDGAIANDRPEGMGVLTDCDGKRYEGEFHDGRPHGRGICDNPSVGMRQEGEWMDGYFQEDDAPDAPVILHAVRGHQSWSVGSTSDWEYKESDFEACTGPLNFTGFGNLRIERILSNSITISRGKELFHLRPGAELGWYAEIEGREWSDGCVYDGDDYKLSLSWVEK